MTNACPNEQSKEAGVKAGRLWSVMGGEEGRLGGRGGYTMTQPPLLYPDPLALVLSDTRAAS